MEKHYMKKQEQMKLSEVKPDSKLSILMSKIRERDEEIKKQANQLKEISKMTI